MSFSRQLKLIWGKWNLKKKIILFTRLQANQNIAFYFCSHGKSERVHGRAHSELAAIRQEAQSNALIHAGLRISRLIFCATFPRQCSEDRNKLWPYQPNRM